MGNIIGGIVGGIGSLFGGQSAKSNDLTGYNYLTGSNGTTGYVQSGNAANTQQADLLGLNGAAGSQAANAGLNNYLNSSQYGFTMNQGTRALTGSAAAKGLLNSGATAKALTSYGQGLAGQQFGNYLSNVSNLGNSGLTAAGQIGSAGTQGGTAAGSAMQSGISSAGGQLAGTLANNGNSMLNFFGSLL